LAVISHAISAVIAGMAGLCTSSARYPLSGTNGLLESVFSRSRASSSCLIALLYDPCCMLCSVIGTMASSGIALTLGIAASSGSVYPVYPSGIISVGLLGRAKCRMESSVSCFDPIISFGGSNFSIFPKIFPDFSFFSILSDKPIKCPIFFCSKA
jgi:hypothetical protein